MKAILFLLAWIFVALAVFGAAFAATRTRETGPERTRRVSGSMPGSARLLVGLTAIALLVLVPGLVLASTSDRLPSGAGTYTLESSEDEREGREVFREVCASCHTLSAASARGVYGPNLDEMGGLTAGRVEGAIDNGGATGKRMPKALLDGEDKQLVSTYVEAVAGN